MQNKDNVYSQGSSNDSQNNCSSLNISKIQLMGAWVTVLGDLFSAVGQTQQYRDDVQETCKSLQQGDEQQRQIQKLQKQIQYLQKQVKKLEERDWFIE